MTGARWRLVQAQNGGVEEVSTVVVTEDEAREFLLDEASMHERFGWTVTVGFNLEGEPDVVIARKSPPSRPGMAIERILTVREFTALEDVL